MDLLNALLCDREGFEEINSVSYLNNEHTPEWKDGKSIRYDILCETSSGHRFIVEMQKASQPKFLDRATFYVSRGVAEQGYRGKKEEDVEWDYSLKPVIGVFLCNFHVTALAQRAIVRASVMDEDSLKPIGMKTRYIFVQLPFFDKEEEECTNLDEKWIYNIKNMGIRQEVAFRNNSEVFKRLAEVANVATLSPEQRYHYEADVKNARDTLNQIRGAYQEGEKKGREEGKIDVAREMKKRGMDLGDIMLLTGLSEAQISSL